MTRCRCASAPTGSRTPRRAGRLRAGRHRSCPAPCEDRRLSRPTTARSSTRAVLLDWRSPAPWSTRCCAGWTALSGAQRFEQAAPSGIGSPPSCAPAPGCSGLTSLTTSPSWSPPGRRRRRLGAGGRPPRPPRGGRRRPARRHPEPIIEALPATAEVVAPAIRPDAAALAEESELILRWLEGAGDPLVRSRTLGRCRPAAPARSSSRVAPPLYRKSELRIHSPTVGGRPMSQVRRVRQRDAPDAGRMITAIVMVAVESDHIPELAEQLAALDGVTEVYSVAGDVDLIAIVRVREFDQIAAVIAGRLNKVARVQRTDTHIAFRADSPRPRRAFSIGFDPRGLSPLCERDSQPIVVRRAGGGVRRSNIPGLRPRDAAPVTATPGAVVKVCSSGLLGPAKAGRRRAGRCPPQRADDEHHHDCGHDRVAAHPHDRPAGPRVRQRRPHRAPTPYLYDGRGGMEQTIPPVNVSTAIAIASISHRAGSRAANGGLRPADEERRTGRRPAGTPGARAGRPRCAA